ncbi:TPA: phage BR0599 family protein [Pseudomonas aeruginosa]
MSIGENELSVQDARPIELFEVSYTGNYWYYNTSSKDIVLDGRRYIAAPCSHEDIIPTVDAEKTGNTAVFPADAGFGEVFRVQPPSEVVSMSIRMQNYLVPSELVTIWKGRIINVAWNGEGMLEAVVENVFSSLQRPGLRRRFSITCPYALYSASCGVNRDDFRDDTPVLAMAGLGLVLQAAIGKPDDYYAGGYVTWENNIHGNQEKRMVRQSVGATGTLILASPPIALSGGQVVSAYAGCDHLIATCDSKFDNSDNCGATPYIPKKNPFGGSTIY